MKVNELIALLQKENPEDEVLADVPERLLKKKYYEAAFPIEHVEGGSNPGKVYLEEIEPRIADMNNIDPELERKWSQNYRLAVDEPHHDSRFPDE
jgi:hypothetical protein